MHLKCENTAAIYISKLQICNLSKRHVFFLHYSQVSIYDYNNFISGNKSKSYWPFQNLALTAVVYKKQNIHFFSILVKKILAKCKFYLSLKKTKQNCGLIDTQNFLFV